MAVVARRTVDGVLEATKEIGVNVEEVAKWLLRGRRGGRRQALPRSTVKK
jgi:hypothetical protein